MSTAPNKRVFILDDEVVIASTLAMILRSQGIDTTSFSEPLKALEAARSNAPSLIISDIMMPSMSGIDLAIQMQSDCPDCKVLLFSGQSSTKEMLDDARTRNFRVMAKPVYPGELLKRVDSLIGVQRPLGLGRWQDEH
jgi:DNA-binding NtrC family response regulator